MLRAATASSIIVILDDVGLEKPAYNAELRPSPLEIGFHEFFGIPALPSLSCRLAA